MGFRSQQLTFEHRPGLLPEAGEALQGGNPAVAGVMSGLMLHTASHHANLGGPRGAGKPIVVASKSGHLRGGFGRARSEGFLVARRPSTTLTRLRGLD